MCNLEENIFFYHTKNAPKVGYLLTIVWLFCVMKSSHVYYNNKCHVKNKTTCNIYYLALDPIHNLSILQKKNMQNTYTFEYVQQNETVSTQMFEVKILWLYDGVIQASFMLFSKFWHQYPQFCLGTCWCLGVKPMCMRTSTFRLLRFK